MCQCLTPLERRTEAEACAEQQAQYGQDEGCAEARQNDDDITLRSAVTRTKDRMPAELSTLFGRGRMNLRSLIRLTAATW
jgi:hypothetical protein